MIKIFYMDEGIIYEEGTPEEIFENPKKDKTLQFVKKLFVLEEEILSRDYDFEVLVKKIYKQMTQMKSIGNIWHNSVLLLDELINNVLFVLLEDPLHIHLRMECKKDSRRLASGFCEDHQQLRRGHDIYQTGGRTP